MTLQEIKPKVLQSDNIAELYEMELELTEKLSDFHLELAEFNQEGKNDPSHRIKIKADITLANSLLNICKRRTEEVLDKDQRFNYNFRMAAMDMLTGDTYQKIADLASLPRPTVRKKLREFHNNKLQ